MIIRENIVEVSDISEEFILKTDKINRRQDELIFFDLEHYVYKKPKCIGVFGACIFNNDDKKLHVTQYMIENKSEVVDILILARRYFIDMKKHGKNSIVTFSGNNDFTVINYLFKKYNIQYDFSKEFQDIDIQREYERVYGHSIGLKNLEKVFEIFREGELISGSNLAKTFHKVLKDREYILRMPKKKVENILLYNEQDVTNLYNIFTLWNKFIIETTEIKDDEEETKIDKENDNDKLVDNVNEKYDTKEEKIVDDIYIKNKEVSGLEEKDNIQLKELVNEGI
ncbi:ribonuclease H-like domain-containing protein [Clostridium septicum]|uniref:Exonuclease n=1 Tax=Clostridium septicum TaxID=1504 RepID=A0A9N7PJV5_CLOSE|nr:ribonuclease H-like domain-containing protein [Clostridium septicum]AYE33312.1 exonuclease [Clostridium septicum]MDU1314451.1 ribonuclease H-like domain-containing protein [Clostridium septicum]QAS61482.1 exonuclease [Clostridium septicum]UEC22081.1 ribonuclease H-like domain-containing protein [Clostridium septicum]USR99887.1 ribonuclease H-like domain-containing protein [Clostridium septicum]